MRALGNEKLEVLWERKNDKWLWNEEVELQLVYISDRKTHIFDVNENYSWNQQANKKFFGYFPRTYISPHVQNNNSITGLDWTQQQQWKLRRIIIVRASRAEQRDSS